MDEETQKLIDGYKKEIALLRQYLGNAIIDSKLNMIALKKLQNFCRSKGLDPYENGVFKLKIPSSISDEEIDQEIDRINKNITQKREALVENVNAKAYSSDALRAPSVDQMKEIYKPEEPKNDLEKALLEAIMNPDPSGKTVVKL